MNQFEQQLDELEALERLKNIVREIVREEIQNHWFDRLQAVNIQIEPAVIRYELEEIYNNIEKQFEDE